MSNLDLNNLTAEQEYKLRDAYRYLRERAAWFRAQKKAVPESRGSSTNTLRTANRTESMQNDQ